MFDRKAGLSCDCAALSRLRGNDVGHYHAPSKRIPKSPDCALVSPAASAGSSAASAASATSTSAEVAATAAAAGAAAAHAAAGRSAAAAV